MILRPGALPRLLVIEPERKADERGWFARTWCRREFAAAGLTFEPVQCSASFNAAAGTLRGMHYQAAPDAEAKIVRCTRGRVFDVAVDLRPDSPTFRGWHAEELSADNGRAILVPAGCAHGFLTLEEASEVFYMIDAEHRPDSARGVRWDDPAFGIRWPRPPAVVSNRDRKWPDFTD